MNNTLIDGNPKWQNVEELALRFLMIHESNGSDKPVNMMHEGVDRERNLCGAPACHAGWYAAYSDEEDVDAYEDGKKLMSRLLGFVYKEGEYLEDQHRLKRWAVNNPCLWGNHNGNGMFNSREAFGQIFGAVASRPLTIKDISDHWLDVAKRLYEIQEVQQ